MTKLKDRYKAGDIITIVQVTYRWAYVAQIAKVGRKYLHIWRDYAKGEPINNYNTYKIDPSDGDHIILAGEYPVIGHRLTKLDHEYSDAVRAHESALREATWNFTMRWQDDNPPPKNPAFECVRTIQGLGDNPTDAAVEQALKVLEPRPSPA